MHHALVVEFIHLIFVSYEFLKKSIIVCILMKIYINHMNFSLKLGCI